MYLNPSAREWKADYEINPAVLELHRKLPDYGQTPLHALSNKLCSQLRVKNVLFKDESNRFGLPAFKILGASWASYRAATKQLGVSETSSLEEVREAASANPGLRLYAASEGNFGRAVARMASTMGVAATVFVPKLMVENTKQLIASEGAVVSVVDGDYDAAVRAAEIEASSHSDGLLIQDNAWPGYEEIPQASL